MGWKISNRSKSSGSSSSTAAGGGCLILFGLVFAGFGLVFIYMISRQALDEAKIYQWEEVPCQIERCEIRVDKSQQENPFQIEVRYKYSFNGQALTSDRYSLQGHWTDDYEKLALRRRDLLGGSPVICYVDPENPRSSVLKREGLGTSMMVLLPLIFVVVGVGIIWGGIYSLRKKKKMEAGVTESISSRSGSSKKTGWVFLIVFGGVFALVGAGVGIPLGIMPIKKMVGSRTWVETPCKIIWSRVQRHESTSDGKTSITYSVDIFYEYEFNGEPHRSNKYGTFGGSSSGRSGKVAITRQYSVGSQQICYVNPKIPEQALLMRGFSWMALLCLLPLVFFMVGVLVMWSGFKARAKATPKLKVGGRFADAYKTDPHEEEGHHLRSGSTVFSEKLSEGTVSGDSKELKPGAKRLWGAVGMLIFALFWNGIVSVFVWQVVEGFQKGRPEWFLTLFMIPFVLIGLAVILLFFYQLLALTNPKPVITLAPGILRSGQAFELSWKIATKASRIKHMKIALWGVESATYRRGTNTHTSHEVFYVHVLFESTLHSDVRSGMVNFELPVDAMPSLDTGNNAIKWELRVNGDIPFWPDVRDNYEVEVRS